ncbi:MAG: hypothetical protein ACJ8C4_05340 [Gemmataceae bacterium]
MKGFIAKSISSSALLAGLAATTGCYGEGKCIDPCYPERYAYASRQEVTAAFAPQVQNGDILYHTMWNFYFDGGKDELNNSGRDHLDALMRRRPYPSGRIYLATARDIPYDPLNPEKFVEFRRDLDERRGAAIQRYLGAQTAGRPAQFEILVHDPAEVGQGAHPANRAVLLNQNTTLGSIAISSSASTAGQGQGGSNGGSVPPPSGGH